jgi:LSM domain
LHSVDQYLNIKLQDVTVVQPEKYPQLTALQNCFIRGSVVRYIQIPPEFVDTELRAKRIHRSRNKRNRPAVVNHPAAQQQQLGPQEVKRRALPSRVEPRHQHHHLRESRASNRITTLRLWKFWIRITGNRSS